VLLQARIERSAMDPVLVLRDPRLQVRPGDTVRTTATVRNTSDLVEQYVFDVLGPTTAWAEVIPPSISVVRRGESTVQVLFRPPVGPSTPSGTVPFALRCASRENPDSVAVAEGDLAVGAIHEIVASLTPAVSRGRWAGRWTARFENRGTAPARLRLSASDERRTLGFALAPAELEIGPGESGYAFLKARAARPALVGAMTRQRVRLSYTRATGPDEAPAEGFVDVAFEHVPVLSRAVAALAGVALVGGAAAVVLLSRSTPRDEVAAPGAPPPAPAGFSAETGEAGVVRLNWSPVPGVSGYRIDKITAGDIVEKSTAQLEPQLGAYEWKELAGGREACFRLVALNDSGPSRPSDRVCAPAGSAPEPTGPPPTTSGPPTPGGSPTPDGSPSPSPTVTTGPPTPIGPGPGTGREPRDAFVVYQLFKKDDRVVTDAQKPLQVATKIESTLGVDVVIADAEASKRLSAEYPGGWIVLYTDAFASEPDARRFCDTSLTALQTIGIQICRPHGT
jgi:hypothetical protein